MSTIVCLILIALGLWILIHFKKNRADGELITRVHPYRRLMWHIMEERKDALVYADDLIASEKLTAYLALAKDKLGADITHCLIGAAALALANLPELNRFVVGRRLYQRSGCWISFSMKRKHLDKKAKMSVVKIQIKPGLNFKDLCQQINQQINHERSGVKTYADKEFALFNLLPRCVLNIATNFCRWLDYHNHLPSSFISNDPLYASAIITNVGSLDMDASYHHLYEWGNCPFFAMAGKISDHPRWLEDPQDPHGGRFINQKVLPLRYSYDERIADGLTVRDGLVYMKMILEDPFTYFGCLEDHVPPNAYLLDRPLC